MTAFNEADGRYQDEQKDDNNNRPVKLTANETGNDREEEKARREIERGIKGRTQR